MIVFGKHGTMSMKGRQESARPALVFVPILFGICVWSSPACALKATNAPVAYYGPTGDFTLPSPQSVADSCLPLLKVRHTSPVSTTDGIQRSAGQAAALGFVFGIRIALGPREQTGPAHVSIGPELWQSSDDGSNSALAVAEYRRCKNEQMLGKLTD